MAQNQATFDRAQYLKPAAESICVNTIWIADSSNILGFLISTVKGTEFKNLAVLQKYFKRSIYQATANS